MPQVILLTEDAQALVGRRYASLHARQLAGRRVFQRSWTPIRPQLGWVLCTTDKTDAACAARGAPASTASLTFDGASLAAGHYVCPSCGGYLRMTSDERIDDLLDAGTFQEWDRVIEHNRPARFPGLPRQA